jgi:hypothetical protein
MGHRARRELRIRMLIGIVAPTVRPRPGDSGLTFDNTLTSTARKYNRTAGFVKRVKIVRTAGKQTLGQDEQDEPD